MVYLELWEGWGSSEVVTGTSRTSLVASANSSLLSSCEGALIPLESLQGDRTSSQVEAGKHGVPLHLQQTLGSLSNFNREVKPHPGRGMEPR